MFRRTAESPKAAIARHRNTLTAIVAQLIASLAVYGGLESVLIPRTIHDTLLRVVRPAESALRRMIVIAARGLVAEPAKPRAVEERVPRKLRQKPRAPSVSFQLFDPVIRAGGSRVIYRTKPFRISFIEPPPPFAPVFARPTPPAPPLIGPPASEVSALALCRRLKALTAALHDLPREAKRLVRLRARRELRDPPSKRRLLRSSRPPGFRKVPVYAVDFILADCDRLAHGALALDTS